MLHAKLDAFASTLLIQQPVSRFNNVAQSQQNHIQFGHLNNQSSVNPPNLRKNLI